MLRMRPHKNFKPAELQMRKILNSQPSALKQMDCTCLNREAVLLRRKKRKKKKAVAIKKKKKKA